MHVNIEKFTDYQFGSSSTFFAHRISLAYLALLKKYGWPIVLHSAYDKFLVTFLDFNRMFNSTKVAHVLITIGGQMDLRTTLSSLRIDLQIRTDVRISGDRYRECPGNKMLSMKRSIVSNTFLFDACRRTHESHKTQRKKDDKFPLRSVKYLYKNGVGCACIAKKS